MAYFLNSFQSPLPWTNCTEVNLQNISCQEYFYNEEILHKSDGINQGWFSLNEQLLGLLLLAWIIVYFCLWKSIKATGKVVYVTATLPYVLLIVFLVRAATLPGAADGLTFFLLPRWRKKPEGISPI